MAISPYKTFSSGEVLTAADLNSSFSHITNNGESLAWPATESKDFNAQELILDADQDTSITADTDDQIDFKAGGADRLVLTATSLTMLGAEIRADGDSGVIASQVFS